MLQLSPQQSPPSTPPLQNVAASRTQSAEEARADALGSVDFQNFLKLLTAQLRNQDPLSPIESTEFVAQLASFSTVEQLVSANQKLDAIAAAMIGGGIEQFAGWIGKEAELNGAPVYFDGAAGVKFRIAADISVSSVQAVVTDVTGTEVSRFNVQNTDEIQTWDGQIGGAAAPAGLYVISAAYYQDGAPVRSAPANIFATVNEIRLNNGAPSLRFAGGVEIDPADVVGLKTKG